MTHGVLERVVIVATACTFSACNKTDSGPPQAPAATTSATAAPSAPAPAAESTGGDIAADGIDHYHQASKLAAAGRFAESRAAFESGIRKDPLDGFLAAGVAILRDHDAGRVPGDVVQRLFRAAAHGDAGRWTEGYAELDEAAKLAPAYARLHETRALLLMSQGKYEDAVPALDETLRLDSTFALSYYNRGAVLAELKEFDAAIADYDRAIELQPSLWYAYRNRGSARTFKDDADGAIADFTKTLELRPRDAETFFLRGSALGAVGKPQDAIDDFRKFLELAGPEHRDKAALVRHLLAELERRPPV
jgi:tetratricopeptide (TPR) repeat protein